MRIEEKFRIVLKSQKTEADIALRHGDLKSSFVACRFSSDSFVIF